MELKVTDFNIDDVGVATVRFNRPGRGNSWTSRMNAEYRWIMHKLDADPAVRVIVVTGAGKQFCVGADFKALDHYAETGEDYGASVNSPTHATPGYGVRPEYDHDIAWHWGLKKPVIAAINGACAGMAMAIASFCDFRYGAAGAKITTAAAKLGMPAEYGLSWLLPRIIGLTHAVDLLMTSRIVLAEEAYRMGFLNGVFAQDQFHARVNEIARGMAQSLSPMAAAVTKRQIYAELMSDDVGASVEHSKHCLTIMMKTADFKEGARTLQDGKPPRFAALAADASIPQPGQ